MIQNPDRILLASNLSDVCGGLCVWWVWWVWLLHGGTHAFHVIVAVGCVKMAKKIIKDSPVTKP